MSRSRVVASQPARASAASSLSLAAAILSHRSRARLHQPQHPYPFLVRLARVLGELGPRLQPHRGQPPVEKRRRLGHGPVLPLEPRQPVKRIKDLRAPAERPAMLRQRLGPDRDRHPVVVQLHPHRPVGVADRHRVGDRVHPHVPELLDDPRDDAAGGGVGIDVLTEPNRWGSLSGCHFQPAGVECRERLARRQPQRRDATA